MDLSSNVTGSCVIGVKSHWKLIRVVLGHFLVNFKVKQNSIKTTHNIYILIARYLLKNPKASSLPIPTIIVLFQKASMSITCTYHFISYMCTTHNIFQVWKISLWKAEIIFTLNTCITYMIHNLKLMKWNLEVYNYRKQKLCFVTIFKIISTSTFRFINQILVINFL